VNPPADPKPPFFREDGSFRFLSAEEFATMSGALKTEYLDLVSKELRKSLEQLRADIARRDKEPDN